MNSNPPPKYDEVVSAQPVKSFFVDMLTRDIQIEDAILDLLDNCVDGILRSQSTPENEEDETPYTGFQAKIIIENDSFIIEDNCGGIPWSEHHRAFRMGRPASANNTPPSRTVGVYGIGMKRAIFKLGREAYISTQNGDYNYEVLISDEWLNAEDKWDLPVTPEKKRLNQDGTEILVRNLNPDVREIFSADNFIVELIKKIESHYAVIIRKGFKVTVNDKDVIPKSIVVRYSSESKNDQVMRPYIFRGNYEGVEIFVTVGLREPIPGLDRISDEQEGVRFSSDYAGWTIICNDRVVVYCDRSEVTGWGSANVPRYHTQFIAISGVVEFRGDPTKLPTTTTKRGMKFESSIYQKTLDRMREGLKLFTDFTNKWKTMESVVEKLVSEVPAIPYSQVKKESEVLNFSTTRRGLEGELYKPDLPMPPNTKVDVRLSYTRPKEKVLQLAEKILPDIEELREKEIPRSVGEASFEFAYRHFFGQ